MQRYKLRVVYRGNNTQWKCWSRFPKEESQTIVCGGLALAPEKFPLQADTFGSAAGTAGKQKWFPDFAKQCKNIIAPTLLLLAPDIRSWTLSRMTSFSLAAISKRNKVPAKRRGLCKGDGGPHSSRSASSWDPWTCVVWFWQLPSWAAWNMGLLQWTRCSGRTGAAAPIERWGAARGSWWFCLLAKPFFLDNAALVVTTVAVVELC